MMGNSILNPFNNLFMNEAVQEQADAPTNFWLGYNTPPERVLTFLSSRPDIPNINVQYVEQLTPVAGLKVTLIRTQASECGFWHEERWYPRGHTLWEYNFSLES